MNDDLAPAQQQEAVVDQWLTDQHSSLIESMRTVLDIEAGLQEIALHTQYRSTVDGIAEQLDVEAGLAAILPVQQQAEPDASPRVRGTVKWFNADKGYGYIALDNGPDVFVHYTALQMDGYRALEVGQRVELEVVAGAEGPVGEKVRAL